MASTVLYSSVNPSPRIFSKTHFAIPISKDFSEELLHSAHCNCYFRSRKHGSLKTVTKVKATVTEAPPANQSGGIGDNSSPPIKKLKILLAGGGIGGLLLALVARRKGFEVVVFEKDLGAIRGEGQYRGPIQIQSNTLAALEATDLDVAD